jgi:hypothetical protein
MHLVLGQNNSDKCELSLVFVNFISCSLCDAQQDACSNIRHHGAISRHVMVILTSFYRVYLRVNFKLQTTTFVRAYRTSVQEGVRTGEA